MSGWFVAVVGPSGAGKDSLIRAVAERFSGDPDFATVKRFVTRSPDASEDHHALDEETFAKRERAGGFALTWRAHGLSYGVPAQADAALAGGKTVVCNLSRAAVEPARRRWPRVWVALVTASPETLARRLAARGREAPADRQRRLDRSGELAMQPDAVIDNEGPLAEAAERLCCLISTLRNKIA